MRQRHVLRHVGESESIDLAAAELPVGPVLGADGQQLRFSVELPGRDGGTDRAVTGTRRVFFDDWVDTPTYNRPDLAPGDVVSGPAIIEEFGSTVPVHPGFAATVDPHGNLLIERELPR